MYRNYNRKPRFYDFHGMKSKRDSTGCINGKDHEIKRGEYIGWAPRFRVACCATCWAKWEDENREADYLESNPGACWKP